MIITEENKHFYAPRSPELMTKPKSTDRISNLPLWVQDAFLRAWDSMSKVTPWLDEEMMGRHFMIPVYVPNFGYCGDVIPGYGLWEKDDTGIPRVLYKHTELWKLPNNFSIKNYTKRYIREYFDQIHEKYDKYEMAITTRDGIISARGSPDDWMFNKASYTTVANVWSAMYRAGGYPIAGTYSNIPAGAVHTNNSVGAMFVNSPGSSEKYLLTFGVNTPTGTNVILLVDLLVAAGNILATVNTSQTVNSTAQTRQYGATLGQGVCATFDVTTAIGTTASNLRMSSYTNSAGTAAKTTAATAMVTSAIAQRLMPVLNGPMIALASGDLGVRSVETCILSAAMTTGIMALNLYYPIMLIPTISVNTYVERDTTINIDGLFHMDKDGSNDVGCLTTYILTSTTSIGATTLFLRTCSG